MDAVLSLALWGMEQIVFYLFPVFPEPVVAHGDLHGVDAWIRHIQPCIGNMLVTRSNGDGLILSNKIMEPEPGMGGEVHIGSRRFRYKLAGEEHSSANLRIWSDRFGSCEIPRHIQGIEGGSISIVAPLECIGLNKVVERNYIGGPLKHTTHLAVSNLTREHLANAQSGRGRGNVL